MPWSNYCRSLFPRPGGVLMRPGDRQVHRHLSGDLPGGVVGTCLDVLAADEGVVREALPGPAHRRAGHPQPLRNLHIGQPIRTGQHDPAPQSEGLRRTRPPRPPNQRVPLLAGQRQHGFGRPVFGMQHRLHIAWRPTPATTRPAHRCGWCPAHPHRVPPAAPRRQRDLHPPGRDGARSGRVPRAGRSRAGHRHRQPRPRARPVRAARL